MYHRSFHGVWSSLNRILQLLWNKSKLRTFRDKSLLLEHFLFAVEPHPLDNLMSLPIQIEVAPDNLLNSF